MTKKYNILIIGGGAAGFFAAIRCAEQNPNLKIGILEQSQRVLEKVKISGGGRCNVTHACFEPKELTTFYPRGNKALLGPFHQFMCGDMLAWLEENNVETKIEADGRIFPTSNKSQTIIDCFTNAVEHFNIELSTQTKVKQFYLKSTESTNPTDKTARKHWEITTSQGNITAQKLIIATGSSRKIWEHLATLGHTIESAVPSLFTFNIKDPLLKDLPGVVAQNGMVQINDSKLKESGPILITHWGLSGPGILKLSAWGARLLNQRAYKFDITINWSGRNLEEIKTELKETKQNQSRKKIGTTPLFDLPKRLWLRMTDLCKISGKNWADLSKKSLEELAQIIGNCKLTVDGKSTNKEEFVTCGGINLDEVNFKTMESKKLPNLYFAGEVLDIDGVTGGFNFQAARTTAWIAAQDAVKCKG